MKKSYLALAIFLGAQLHLSAQWTPLSKAVAKGHAVTSRQFPPKVIGLGK